MTSNTPDQNKKPGSAVGAALRGASAGGIGFMAPWVGWDYITNQHRQLRALEQAGPGKMTPPVRKPWNINPFKGRALSSTGKRMLYPTLAAAGLGAGWKIYKHFQEKEAAVKPVPIVQPNGPETRNEKIVRSAGAALNAGITVPLIPYGYNIYQNRKALQNAFTEDVVAKNPSVWSGKNRGLISDLNSIGNYRNKNVNSLIGELSTKFPERKSDYESAFNTLKRNAEEAARKGKTKFVMPNTDDFVRHLREGPQVKAPKRGILKKTIGKKTILGIGLAAAGLAGWREWNKKEASEMEELINALNQ